MNENKRASEVYSLNVCEFSCGAAAGRRPALDAEYFIHLYTLAKDEALNHGCLADTELPS